jgi:hypothetical protein
MNVKLTTLAALLMGSMVTLVSAQAPAAADAVRPKATAVDANAPAAIFNIFVTLATPARPSFPVILKMGDGVKSQKGEILQQILYPSKAKLEGNVMQFKFHSKHQFVADVCQAAITFSPAKVWYVAFDVCTCSARARSDPPLTHASSHNTLQANCPRQDCGPRFQGL